MGASAGRYLALAVAQMCTSAVFSTLGVELLPMLPEVCMKAIVDTCLFLQWPGYYGHVWRPPSDEGYASWDELNAEALRLRLEHFA